MADGLCLDHDTKLVVKSNVNGLDKDDYVDLTACERINQILNVDECDNSVASAKPFYLNSSDSDKLFDKLAMRSNKMQPDDGFSTDDLDDCRKKRCVDRYDSSESSDSGVAVLSCTDCSGSSTASGDITDPGSPFSTTSTHSEDSHGSPPKMPPTQNVHHPSWPWNSNNNPNEECSSPSSLSSINKRGAIESSSNTHNETAAVFPKRLKANESSSASPILSLSSPNASPNNNNNNKSSNNKNLKRSIVHTMVSSPATNSDTLKCININVVKKLLPACNKRAEFASNQQAKQGKITEYFKSQIKLQAIKKPLAKLVEQTKNSVRTIAATARKVQDVKKTRQTVPRKILPAPTKLPLIDNNLNLNFSPTVTLATLSFPPNLAYLHTKAPKPPDCSVFMPQFAITNDHLPILGHHHHRTATPCLNVVHAPKMALNEANFNCVKLNGTVVPIVKLNTLPHQRLLSKQPKLATVITPKQAIVQVQEMKQQQQRPVDSIEMVGCSSGCSNRSSSEKSLSRGDSDSGVSSLKDNLLEVEVCERVAIVPEQILSPILSQPKTIRFPVAKRDKNEVKDAKAPRNQQESGLCKWAQCSAQFDTSGALLEHLQVKHVISQAAQEQYVCLWLGCKVHGRTSCSRSWLERHVLAHAGTKPFRCIVDGCGQRFNSQVTLERHVNGHFTGDGNSNSSTKKTTETSSTKLFKRNGKKIRFRRQPWSARMFDFIDSGIMEGLQHKLLKVTQDRTMGQLHQTGDTMDVRSEVVARRTEPDGRVQFLVRWHPTNIVPDEWVAEKEYVKAKSVLIPALQPSAKDALNSRLFTQNERQRRPRKQPISKQQT